MIDFIFDSLETALCFVLENLKMTVKMLLLNHYGRLFLLCSLIVWLTVTVIYNRKEIALYLKLYFKDVKAYRNDLKNYDDIDFKLFRRTENGYTLKDFMPVTKDRLTWFNLYIEYLNE